MKIGNRFISDKHPPLIVGEVSANHGKSLKKIFRIIDCASEIGLEAIKFQTFDLNEMTLNLNQGEFKLNRFSNKKWNNRNLYSLYKDAQLPYEWHKKIFDRANKKGLICFSSVFDEKSLNFLEKLRCPAYKIASMENLHYPLVESVIRKNKPTIISTGTLNFAEIKNLIKSIKIKKKINSVVIMYCLTEYPAKYKNLNLNFIKKLKKDKNLIVGFSDHTDDNVASISAVTLGANIIEKHFKLFDNDNTLDSEFSIGPKKMEELILGARNVWESLKNKSENISSDEKFYIKFRRSIYATKTINKGNIINFSNTKIIRPGLGLSPKLYKKILGKKTNRKIKLGTPIKLSFIS